MRRLTLLGRGLLAALFIFVVAAVAEAHGIGTPQVLNQPAGPYLLSAWTDPDPLRVDETHVVVGVTDAATNEPIVAGVEVAVTLTSTDDPAVTITQIAPADNVNRLLYAAEFNGRLSAGRWQVTLRVSGERGVGEGVAFPVEVQPARGFNWLWLGVGGLAAVVLVWVMISLRGDKPARPEGPRSGMSPR